MALVNFYPGTTKAFSVAISHNGATPDITADSVTFYLKRAPSDPDSAALIVATGDVATAGASGTALFTLTPATTAIEPRGYHYDIVWRLAGGAEYVLERGTIAVVARVSDV